jgi:hypothetical protein
MGEASGVVGEVGFPVAISLVISLSLHQKESLFQYHGERVEVGKRPK